MSSACNLYLPAHFAHLGLIKNLGPGPKKIYGTFVDCVREFVDGDAGELRDSSGLYPGRDAALKGQAFAKIY